MSVNSYAVEIYTSKFEKEDELKFIGTSWCVFKTKEKAKSVGNGKHPKVKRYIKNR